ncbi:MAG: class I SAM-dependent methyltransferase [Magnetospirillum sp.]|nr:class I SAM-dependent methyltransferase [Magnetospirillum sp.]
MASKGEGLVMPRPPRYCSAGNAEARTMLKRARELVRRGQSEAALTLARAHAQTAGDPASRLALGRVLLLANQPAAAARVFETLAAETPDLPGVADALAAAWRRDARYAEAVALAAAAADPGPQLLYEAAMSLAALGEAEPALAAFDRGLGMEPTLAAAWFGAAGPALEVGGFAAAIDRLQRALACPGAAGRYWAPLWALKRLSGDAAGAETVFAAHLAGHPRRRPLADSLAALLPAAIPAARVFGLSAPLLRHALTAAAVPGLVIEFGVRRGTSIAVLAAAAVQEVHGFDSFEGLPEAWGSAPQGVLTTGRCLPAVAGNVRLHAGWFADTVAPVLAAHPGPLRLANIDSDLYSSAKTVLDALGPRLVPGSVLVFDEMIGNRHWRDHEWKAWHEHAAATGRRWEAFAVGPFTKQVAIRVVE